MPPQRTARNYPGAGLGRHLSEARSRNDQTRKSLVSEHYRIVSGSDEKREIQDGPQSGALARRGSAGMLSVSAQIQETTRCSLNTQARAESQFLSPAAERWEDDEPRPAE